MRKAIAIALLALASLAAFANRGNGGAVRGAAARAGMMGGRFTEVQWLQNDGGNAYINTGYKIASERFNFTFKFRRALSSSSSTYDRPFLGTTRCGLNTADYWAGDFYYGYASTNDWHTIELGQYRDRNTDFTINATYNNGTATIVKTGNEGGTRTKSFVGSIIGGDDFCIWRVGGSLGTAGTPSERIYYFKMTDNGILVRDFVPVRDTAGNGYMLDKVTGQLFGNSGTGAFIVGPDK